MAHRYPKALRLSVNIGGATAQDILDLIAFCQKEVKDKFGVTLETEVKIVGEE